MIMLSLLYYGWWCTVLLQLFNRCLFCWLLLLIRRKQGMRCWTFFITTCFCLLVVVRCFDGLELKVRTQVVHSLDIVILRWMDDGRTEWRTMKTTDVVSVFPSLLFFLPLFFLLFQLLARNNFYLRLCCSSVIFYQNDIFLFRALIRSFVFADTLIISKKYIFISWGICFSLLCTQHFHYNCWLYRH